MLFRFNPEQHIHLSKSKMNKTLFLYPVLLAMQSICYSSNLDIEQAPTDVYRNPVIAADAPDPSVIRADDGSYYLYATGHGYSIFRSEDLVSWERIGSAFSDETWPAAIRNDRRGDLWAPEIRRIGDRYVLFYSLWYGNVKYSVIGYAVADRPEGPFTDKGVLVDSQSIGVEQSIDQYYYEEEGRAWLFWGSFRGIYAIELDVDADAEITPRPETKTLIAGTAFEGTNIYKRDGWYYLFASTGDFSGGAESTYSTVVGRSRSVTGPYVDRQGHPMTENGYELILSKNDRFVGCGHNAGLVEDDEGKTWMLYHAYQLGNTDAGRLGMLDRVLWDEQGWPSVYDGHPSRIYGIPAITR